MRSIVDAQVDVKTIGMVSQAGENVPEAQGVLSAGDGDKDSIIICKHPIFFDETLRLLRNPIEEMLFAQAQLVLSHVDYGFLAAFSTIHGCLSIQWELFAIGTARNHRDQADFLTLCENLVVRDEFPISGYENRLGQHVDFLQCVSSCHACPYFVYSVAQFDGYRHVEPDTSWIVPSRPGPVNERRIRWRKGRVGPSWDSLYFGRRSLFFCIHGVKSGDGDRQHIIIWLGRRHVLQP